MSHLTGRVLTLPEDVGDAKAIRRAAGAAGLPLFEPIADATDIADS